MGLFQRNLALRSDAAEIINTAEEAAPPTFFEDVMNKEQDEVMVFETIHELAGFLSGFDFKEKHPDHALDWLRQYAEPYFNGARSEPDHELLKTLNEQLKPKELYQIARTLGAMSIQEQRGEWQHWWGKFCRIMQPHIDAIANSKGE